MKYIVYVIIIACLLQESLVECRGGRGGGGGGRGGSRGGSSRGGSMYSGGGGIIYSGSSSSSIDGEFDTWPWVYILLAFGLTVVVGIVILVLCSCCGKKSKNQSGVNISVPPAANDYADDNNNAKNNKVTGIQSEAIDMSYLGTYNLDTNERGPRNINRDPTVKTTYIDRSGLSTYSDVVNDATPQLNRTPKTPYSKGKRLVHQPCKKNPDVFIL